MPPSGPRIFGVLRAAAGVGVLLAPGVVLGGLEVTDPSSAQRWVTRVLGARMALQGLVTAVADPALVLRAGAVVDAIHATSMVGVAATWPRVRVAAFVSAGEAVSSAAAALAFAARSDGSYRKG